MLGLAATKPARITVMTTTMPHWTDAQTTAHHSIGNAVAVVDNLLSFAKDGRGKPSEKERALFAAAVVFTYGIWENFVEELAIEIASEVSKEIDPEKVPEQIKKIFEKRTAWELTVTPGWRALWVDYVRVKAVGDDENRFGMNTAKAGQVENLLRLAGIVDPYERIEVGLIPSHLPSEKNTVVKAINTLVELRGEIVHTGAVPDDLRKKHVVDWRKFVEVATTKMDEVCRMRSKALLS